VFKKDFKFLLFIKKGYGKMRIIFTYPIFLLILLLLPLLFLAHFFVFRKKKPVALKFSNFLALEKVAGKSFLAHRKGFLTKRDVILLLLRTATYIFFILAISGVIIEYYGKVSDFDFVLAIDSSSSMLADDFRPNRLEAAKEAALLFTNYIGKQTNVGIVSFAGDVHTDLRPTNNIKEIKDSIEKIGIREAGGTNIGDALITSGNIFEGDNPKRIILLTDGQANIGPEPIEAVNYLKSKNITVYAIGVATKEGGQVGIEFISKLDEETLIIIAEQTNGRYYRAENRDLLKKTFEDIASFSVEKTSLNLSWIILITAFIILILEWFLATTKYRMIP